jgi:hypothetical protein
MKMGQTFKKYFSLVFFMENALTWCKKPPDFTKNVIAHSHFFSSVKLAINFPHVTQRVSGRYPPGITILKTNKNTEGLH